MNPSPDSDSTATPSLAATARDAASQLKSAARDTTSQARDEARRIASEKKTAAADRIGSYSSAIHESAKSLEEQDPNIAWFTHRAADRLQGVAEYVRERDFNDLRHDAEDVARRHPALFFGGLLVAGVLLGNLIKASSRRLGDNSSWSDDTGASDWASTAPAPEASMSAGI